jgi:hypothetical protein
MNLGEMGRRERWKNKTERKRCLKRIARGRVRRKGRRGEERHHRLEQGESAFASRLQLSRGFTLLPAEGSSK